MYKTVIKPILFRNDPEVIHYKVFSWLKILLNNRFSKGLAKSIFQVRNSKLKKCVTKLQKLKSADGLTTRY